MDNVTAILVDDEISNLKGLEKKIENFFPQIKIIGTYQIPENAILEIEKQQPSLLFLDVEMPRINGFELLTRLKNINTQVIFVTAHSQYAIEAFKQSAIDYILKPFDNDELVQAVNKALEIIKLETESSNNKKLIQFLTKQIRKNNKVIIPTVKGASFVSQEEIIRLEGFDGYTKVHLKNNKTLISSYSIGKYEQQLEKMNFFQCHRSHLINIKYITEYLNEGFVILENNHKVPVSKAKRRYFLNMDFEEPVK